MPVVPYYLGRSDHVWIAAMLRRDSVRQEREGDRLAARDFPGGPWRLSHLDSQGRIDAQAQQDCPGDPLDPRHRDHLQALGSHGNRHGRNGPQAQRAAGEHQERVIMGGQVRRRDLGYVSPLGQEHDGEAGGANPPERGAPDRPSGPRLSLHERPAGSWTTTDTPPRLRTGSPPPRRQQGAAAG